VGSDDPRVHVAESIEYAIAELSQALVALDEVPLQDVASTGWVAHAINNYLSVSEAILGLIDQALRDHPNEEVARWIDGLRHLGNLMHHAAGRLLAAGPPEAFPLKPNRLDLPRLMERACNYYRPAAEQKQLQIVCNPVGNIPLVWADPVAVAVVADNLLSNAVKFSNPGGEIVVQVLPGPGGVVCSVRDRGPGLTPLEQVRLFRPGVRSGPTPTTGGPSTGFGLAIAKELIDRMGGRLWSESEPGQGACFSFRLPYQAAGSSAPAGA
jgi:signal transduction histidine kinase